MDTETRQVVFGSHDQSVNWDEPFHQAADDMFIFRLLACDGIFQIDELYSGVNQIFCCGQDATFGDNTAEQDPPVLGKPFGDLADGTGGIDGFIIAGPYFQIWLEGRDELTQERILVDRAGVSVIKLPAALGLPGSYVTGEDYIIMFSAGGRI